MQTNRTPLRRRALRGERLHADAPLGKGRPQTFIAAVRCDGPTAPWVLEGAMAGAACDTDARPQRAPTLQPGDVVILDNLNVHKSPTAAAARAKPRAWVLFLPTYAPDLTPIERAGAKRKTLLRQAKAPTDQDLWRAAGNICDLFSPEVCCTSLQDLGYVAD